LIPGSRSIESHRFSGPVEAALAYAIRRATEAGRCDVLPQQVSELQARREAQNAPNAPNIVRLPLRKECAG
jgi:hypothetical protein